MSDNDFFIQQATKQHKGKLRRFAESHDSLTKSGKIDYPKTQKAIDNLPSGKNKETRQKELNLARTLKGLRNR